MLSIYTQFIELPDYLLNLGVKICREQPENGVYLVYDEQGLLLQKVGERGVVLVDFIGGSAQYRRIKGGGELLGRAVNHTANPIVWDATGGLGRDGFVLASLGLQVRIFEQNTVAFALLADGLERAKQQPEIADIIANMNLICGDSVDLLPKYATQFGKPDVIYLDPMYPEKKKSAAVKKEMAYFHDLIGLPDADEEMKLFHVARQIATKRVVVKRPRLGRFLCHEKPSYQYEGKSTRFDVYLPFCE